MSTVLTKRFLTTVAFVAVVTSIVNELLALIGKAVSQPPATFGPYMATSVIGLTLVGVLAAAAVYVGMRYWWPNKAQADRYFIILSIVVLIVSFYPDIALPWSTDPDEIGWTYGIIVNLMLMHVVAALPVMYYFTRAE